MDVVEIGYFSKTHGIKGQLLLKASVDFETENLRALFVEMRGGRAPHFVSAVSEMPQGLLITLEDVTAVEQARELLNKKVFIDATLVIAPEAVADLSGYELVDHVFGSLGKIEAVTSNGVQDLVVLTFKGREVLLPLVDEFVEGIDDEKKLVRYKAPEGLIGLFLEGE